MLDGLKVVFNSMVAHIQKKILSKDTEVGSCNHQDIFMVVNGIKMVVAYLMSPSKNPRSDGHPAIWLGKKDAVAEWRQDCMHWCRPGVPDTWVDILSQLINYHLGRG